MYRLGVCDQLVLLKPTLNVWVCVTAFNEITYGISAEPASLDITEKKRTAAERLDAELERR